LGDQCRSIVEGGPGQGKLAQQKAGAASRGCASDNSSTLLETIGRKGLESFSDAKKLRQETRPGLRGVPWGEGAWCADWRTILRTTKKNDQDWWSRKITSKVSMAGNQSSYKKVLRRRTTDDLEWKIGRHRRWKSVPYREKRQTRKKK